MSKVEMVYIETDKLKLNPKNPRKNDGAVDTVIKSIEKYGFKNPLIADSNLVVYCGNTRLKAAKKLGLKEVPVIIADDLTTEQIREYAIIDNKSSEIAEWDFELLNAELADLDLNDFDLDWEMHEEVNGKEIVEDEVPDIDEDADPVCKLGDIWQLGEHRLICDDSTDAETVARLMDGAQADMVFTDPPYNTGMKPKKNRSARLSGFFDDTFTDEEWEVFMAQFCARYFELMKENTVAYICLDWRRALRHSAPKEGLVVDLFGGSGSTLIACEQLGRKCYTAELDPRYCDVIIKRWETLTGKKAVKL